MDLKEKIGIRVKALRKQRGLNQEQLSVLIGKVHDVVSNVERGKTSSSLDLIESICEALKVPVSELFEDIDSKGRVRNRHSMHAEIWAMMTELSDRDVRAVRELVKALTDK